MERIEFRCPECDRLIFKVSDLVGVEVEVKCPRCNEISVARLEAEGREHKH